MKKNPFTNKAIQFAKPFEVINGRIKY